MMGYIEIGSLVEYLVGAIKQIVVEIRLGFRLDSLMSNFICKVIFLEVIVEVT